jgi:hypothetical protein
MLPLCVPQTPYNQSQPCKSMVMLPKASCDVMGNEVVRLMQLTENSIEPARLEVPRKDKGRVLHEDLFPATAAPLPSYSPAEWLHGDADSLEGPKKLPVLQVRQMIGMDVSDSDTHQECADDDDETTARLTRERLQRQEDDKRVQERLKNVRSYVHTFIGAFVHAHMMHSPT